MELGGLHHVSAITGNTLGNVEFYTTVLGLRLVKKTVNQDDPSMYHLFYGDKVGRAGTEMTFFDWPMASPHLAGSGMISATAFRVAGRDSLGWWARRFDENGVVYEETVERDGRGVLRFTDPEGQHLELVDDSEVSGMPGVPPGVPWERSPVPVGPAIRGLNGVTLTVRRLEPSVAFLEDVLGFTKVGELDEYGYRAKTFAIGPGGPGAEVRLVERPDLPFRRMIGAGGVHHVAFRTPDDDEHVAWQERLARTGVGVTPVIDRFYFRSIYFREPGGILFEIATDGPGFTTDEDAEFLGERLSLPPFLESRRGEIETGLAPIGFGGSSGR